MTFLLILIYGLLNCPGNVAIPVDSSAPNVSNTRSTFEILWNCWATIFICTWTSMHPNIPPRGQGTLRALWKNIVLMFWALVVPELVLTWAVKQWLAARAIEKEFKKSHDWTRTHAHFLGMGGFTLAHTIRAKPLEVPQIPNMTVPIQPKLPEWIDDGQHTDRMEHYWKEMEHFRKDRRQFCRTWERAQKNWTEYMYFNPELFSDRELHDLEIQDYKRYETYGFSLRDYITYLYESPGTLSFYRFRDLVNKSLISFPTITAAEIQDRSKGDILSKAIAIFQTTSFILQLAARAVLRLPIAEIELVTLALASLNGITYFFWWDKPLRVQEPVMLYFRGVSVDRREDDSEEGVIAAFLCALRSVPESLASFCNSALVSISTFLRDRIKEIQRSNSHFRILQVTFYWVIYLPISKVVLSLYAIIETSDIPPGATHPPSFYATNITSSELDIYLVYFVLPIIAVGFGGLHCLGWNFTFRTPAERIIWRVCASTITGIPLVSGIVAAFIRKRLSDMRAQREVGQQRIIMRFVVYFAFGALFPVYVFARLLLLVQALVLLWREPRDGVFLAVDWSKYVPHIS